MMVADNGLQPTEGSRVVEFPLGGVSFGPVARRLSVSLTIMRRALMTYQERV